MARSGIYVNGKEIVARYVGDKLVWRKGKWVYFKEVTFPMSSYTWSDISLNAVVIRERQIIFSIPESKKFPKIAHAVDGAYKVKFNNDVEFILESLEIAYNRETHRSHTLMIKFYFRSVIEKQSFEVLVRRGILYSIYARG